MKRIVLLVLSLCLVVVGCNKPSSKVEAVVTSETISSEAMQEERSESINLQDSATQSIQSVDDKDDGLQIVETVTEPYTELKVGPLSYVGEDIKCFYVAQILYDYDFRFLWYEESGKSFDEYERDFVAFLMSEISNISITEVNQEKRTIRGIQKHILTSGKELIYEFEYKFDETASLYFLNYNRLTNPELVMREPRQTRQPKVKMEFMKDDPNREKLTKLFEDYLNSYINFEELGEFNIYKDISVDYIEEFHEYAESVKNNKFSVKEYVKTNLVNSGYDEYLVVFNRGKTLSFIYELDEHIEIMECLIVKDDKVIQSYRINIQNSRIRDNWEEETYDDFVSAFTQGMIGDFNKNGINELIFICDDLFADMKSYSYEMYEFVDDHFVGGILEFNRGFYCDYDWGKEVFIISESYYEPYRDLLIPNPYEYEWIENFIWCEEEHYYIPILTERRR